MELGELPIEDVSDQRLEDRRCARNATLRPHRENAESGCSRFRRHSSSVRCTIRKSAAVFAVELPIQAGEPLPVLWTGH
jgi:hypothetical protein